METEDLQNKLLDNLGLLIAHLDRYGEDRWSLDLSTARTFIDAGDRRGLDALKRMRGEKGSFIDLIICKNNGHLISKEEEDFANKELWRLGDLVFTAADKLSRIWNKC